MPDSRPFPRFFAPQTLPAIAEQSEATLSPASRRPFRRLILLLWTVTPLTGVGGLTGCGQPSSSLPPATSSKIVAETTTSVAATEPAPDLQRLEAERLFAVLTRPGVNPDEWDSAHSQLLSLLPASVEVLQEKLTAGSDMERELAATTLALIGPDARNAEGALLAALRDKSSFVRANAASALLQWQETTPHAIPVLIELLAAEDLQLRQLAAANLNSVGAEASPYVAQLKEALAQENPAEVLTPVVELLGRIGPLAEPAIPVLQKIAFEVSGEVGESARSAIELIQTANAAVPAPGN